MNNRKFSDKDKDLINKMRKARSEEELLQSIPEDMRKRLDNVMNNEEELKKILNSQKALELFEELSKLEEG